MGATSTNAGAQNVTVGNRASDWQKRNRNVTAAQKAWLNANPMFEICGHRGHHLRGFLLADGTIGPAGPASRDDLAVGVRLPCAVDPGNPADIPTIYFR
jgi:hypothetical protein